MQSTKNKALPIRNYPTLLRELRGFYRQTTTTGTQALNRNRLKAYWNIGRKLKAHTAHVKTLLTKLSDDLGTSYTFLLRVRQFYEVWPDGLSSKAKELTWSHHIELIPLANSKIRNFYIEQSVGNGWSHHTLRKAINKNLYENFDEAELITRDPTASGFFNLYKGVTEKVIDGDTLDTRLDVGFHLWISMRVRLKGINCAEMADGGRAAKEFVEKVLATCKNIVVKTHKTDIYGRYLGDVYYHAEFTDKNEIVTKGFHLNAELIKAGLAKPMMV